MSLTKEMQDAADRFVRAYVSVPVVDEFQRAVKAMEADGELQAFLSEYNGLVAGYRKRQSENPDAGELSLQEVTRLRYLQGMISSQPSWKRHARLLGEVTEMSRACNGIISGILGFDFAATAAPPSVC